MSEQPLQRIEPMPTSPSVEGMITLAIEKGASVDCLERLMAIRREVRAEQAKEAYDRALADFQAECPTIQKTAKVMNKDGRSVRYQYAPLDAIIHQVKGLLQKHGFSYSVNAKAEPTQVTAVCKLTHAHGHSEMSEFAVPIDKEAYMNPAQQVASALTFAKRYSFCNACGIMTGDQDDDSQGSHEPKEPPKDNANARQTTAKVPHGTPAPTTPKRDTAPKQATLKTRDWFLAEMRKRFDDSVILQFACDSGPPYALTPNETLEEWPLEHVPTTRAGLEVLVNACAKFMNVEPRTVGENALKPSESDSDRDARADAENASNQTVEPQEAGSDENGEPVLEITGKLEQVAVKEGISKKGKWKRYGVRIGKDFWANSFSATLGKLAEADKGKTVRVLYREGERGNDLVGIEPV